MLTITDIAKELGISHSTVSRALNDSSLISVETKERIQKYANEHGFALNSQAQSLKTQKTGTVGILFPRHFTDFMTNIFYAHIYDLLQKYLIQLGLDIMVIYDNALTDSLSPLERMIQKRKVDGFIILRPDLREKEYEMLMKHSIPHVTLFWSQKSIKPSHNFLINSEQGAYLAGLFLGKQKNSTVLYLGLEDNSGDNIARLQGFIKGVKDSGFKKNVIRIMSSMSLDGGYEGIMKNKNLFLYGNTCSLYVYNDMMAIGAINALHKLNIRIPENIQIIGTDDLPLASSLRPTLSTIKAPIDELINDACDTLFQEINSKAAQPKTIILEPYLLHRETTITTKF